MTLALVVRSWTDWAVFAVAAAGAVVLLVLAFVIANLFRVVSSLKSLGDGIRDETVPLISEVTGTVRGVNKEIERIDSIAGSVETTAANVATISETVKVAVTNPLVKAVAFAFGVRRAGRKMRKDS
ncbi:MAG: DUF948 domain-containing protein [Acidobacteria bacterium]|nr:DUF948 domain-containing protein [Acidobacteriota bacterium]